MLELGFDVAQEQDLIHAQEEPALEIALPQVFTQPALTCLQRGKVPRVEALVAQIFRDYQSNPQGPLGPAYQELVTEFQPLFTWAIACWDYLLSTEGCRFLPRHSKQRVGVRGDYYAMTDKEYSRMVHGIFRACLLEFARDPSAPSLSHWLRERFWPLILAAYRRLENPPDPRQRTLTAYSYLRCTPYEFLNEFHQDLVYTTARRLPPMAWKSVDAYFLHFYTETASAESLGIPVEACRAALRQGLTMLLIHHRLVYCLLRQIERY